MTETRASHRDIRESGNRDWAGRWLREAVNDIPFAIRMLRRAPRFAFVIVLTMGLAIGGTGAVFALVDAVLLEPLPYRNPRELVVIREQPPTAHGASGEVAPVNFDLLTRNNRAFASIAAVAGFGPTLRNGDTPEKIVGRRVTHAFFDVLGIRPALGRVFRADEDRPGGPRVVVLSHTLWRDRFASDPRIIGQDIVLDKDHYTIVGVMPAKFEFLGADVALWTPAAFGTSELAKGANYLTVVARLAPGTTLERAHSLLGQLRGTLAADLPPAADGFYLSPVSLDNAITGEARRPLFVLLSAVAFVLLIGCANVASLLLARGATLEREMALRRSLGATRSRVVRQLLIESFILCVLSLASGVVLAQLALAFLTQLVPPQMLLFAHPALDSRAIAATSLVALATCALFGLAPALYTTAVDLGAVLKSGGRAVSGGSAGRRMLVVGEVATTLVLLVVAGLLIQTMYQLRYADLGFQPANVLSLRTALPQDVYSTQEKRVAFYDDVIDRVSRLPGVKGAAYSTSVPLAWKGATTGLLFDGAAPDANKKDQANLRQVSAGYLSTLGVRLVSGRHFTDADRADAQSVVIVNETMARAYWPGVTAIGRQVKTTDGTGSPWLTVVGVVGDVRQMGLDTPPSAEIYVPYRQFDSQPWFAPRDLIIRTSIDPVRMTSAVLGEIRAIDPALPVTHVRPLDGLLDQEVASRRIGTVVLITFATFAIILAVTGIYGLISYFVAEHTPEIGLRVALGAQSSEILRLVLGRGVTSTALGIAIGVIVAFGASRVVSSLLYGVSAFDPLTVAVASLLLFVVATLGSYLPARRAMKLDAMVALRQQ